jgi:RHS repeat-associated protein
LLNASLSSRYADISRAGTVAASDRYSELLAYDARGNIKTLKRYGKNNTTCSWGLIDDLTYQYDPSITAYNPTNKLYKITDASDLTRGFKSANQSFSYNCNYDVNGNLIWDANKNISNIDYNHLNLPTVITFVGNKTITFLYDAGGNKLRKTVVDNGITQYVQDYVGGIEYRNSVLESIFHSEGRITSIDGVMKYEYALKDHLGNTRIMFSDKNGDGIVQQSLLPNSTTNEITQENHYYAFGMNMESVWVNNTNVVDNRYQYNGKELNEDFGLNWNDYGARFYDATLGRWNAVDPMAEKYYAFSSYVYVLNNPINLIDPNGMYSEDPKLDSRTDKDKEQSLRNTVSMLRSLENDYNSTRSINDQIQKNLGRSSNDSDDKSDSKGEKKDSKNEAEPDNQNKANDDDGLSANYEYGPKGNVTRAVATITNPITLGTATNASSVKWARAFGRKEDDAGHVIGRQLGGSGGVKYVFPQTPNVNQGQFRVFETKIRNMVTAEGSVNIVVTLNYQSTSLTPLRPISISYAVKGAKGGAIYEIFKNP